MCIIINCSVNSFFPSSKGFIPSQLATKLNQRTLTAEIPVTQDSYIGTIPITSSQTIFLNYYIIVPHPSQCHQTVKNLKNNF